METRTNTEGPQWGPRESLTLLNHNLRRVDGPEKVTGRARYTHDIRLPGMVYARLLLCPLPNAEVELDFAAALKLPGVVAAQGLGVQAEQVVHPTPVLLGQPPDAPHHLAPGLEEVFFSIRRTVSRLTVPRPGS